MICWVGAQTFSVIHAAIRMSKVMPVGMPMTHSADVSSFLPSGGSDVYRRVAMAAG